MMLNRLIGLHKNEDFAGLYLGSDEKYDYSIVNIGSNNHSVTRYFGKNGGEYESYPLYLTGNYSVPVWVLNVIEFYLQFHNPKDEVVLQWLKNNNYSTIYSAYVTPLESDGL